MMMNISNHLIPGLILIAFSTWWCWNILHRYVKSKIQPYKSFKNSSSFQSPCLKRIPLEGILKIISTTVVIICELILIIQVNNNKHSKSLHHIALLFFFGLNGLIDVFNFCHLDLPSGLNYVTLALSFIIELLMFVFHTGFTTKMDKLMHHLLIFTIGSVIISLLIEMKNRSSVLAGLSRVYFNFIHGTWLCQIQFVIFNTSPSLPLWDQEDHEQLGLISFIYAVHHVCILVFMLMMGIAIHLYYNCITKKTKKYHLLVIDQNNEKEDISLEKINMTDGV